jgi:hypothetical protein
MRRAWLLLAFAVALAMWLWRSPREEVSDNPAREGGHALVPGYVATGAMLFETDIEGQPLSGCAPIASRNRSHGRH